MFPVPTIPILIPLWLLRVRTRLDSRPYLLQCFSRCDSVRKMVNQLHDRVSRAQLPVIAAIKSVFGFFSVFQTFEPADDISCLRRAVRAHKRPSQNSTFSKAAPTGLRTLYEIHLFCQA